MGPSGLSFNTPLRRISATAHCRLRRSSASRLCSSCMSSARPSLSACRYAARACSSSWSKALLTSDTFLPVSQRAHVSCSGTGCPAGRAQPLPQRAEKCVRWCPHVSAYEYPSHMTGRFAVCLFCGTEISGVEAEEMPGWNVDADTSVDCIGELGSLRRLAFNRRSCPPENC
ncbi:hypothetical protein VTK56DRAFT_7641 [Thermocarpiscus australiensis]